jgi:tetratricopeptide (TPR) repeat protein
VLVVPFQNAQHEPRIHWIGEAAAILLADELNARGVPAIARAERVRAFEQLHLPPAGALSRATVIKVGQMVGASEVVVGSLRLDGGTLVAEAHTIRIDVGRLEPDITERGPLTDLFAVFQRLASRLTPSAATAAPANAEPRPALEAFEQYVKGLLAESPATQATFLETALKNAPAYDRARLALWEVRTEQDDHAAALAAVKPIASDAPLAREGRFLGGVSLLHLKRLDEAFETFKSLADADPPAAGAARRGAAIFNNLGIVQMRRGAPPQAGSAVYYLTKAADADPNDADYLFNLGYAYVLDRDIPGGIYWLREALRRNPADADAHFVLAGALQASGGAVEAARERELARQLSARYEELEKRAAAEKAPVPKGLERVREQLESPGTLGAEQTIVNVAQREQRDLALFHLDRGRRLFEKEQDREALAELRRAVYLTPYEAQAHLLIGRIHLRGGRPQEAVDALKISIWSEETAAARTALGEAYLKTGDKTAARTELERALKLDPASAAARKLLAEIDGR